MKTERALRTCRMGHLTLFRDCPICKGAETKRLRKQNVVLRKENGDLRRELKAMKRMVP